MSTCNKVNKILMVEFSWWIYGYSPYHVFNDTMYFKVFI